MGAVKEHGEISTNHKVSETLSNSATLGLRASSTVVNPTTTVSTTAAYPTPTTTDNSTTATKSINSDYFLWIVNHFCKKATHESDGVIGFTAVRSATMNCNFNPTFLAPILPYPPTIYDVTLII